MQATKREFTQEPHCCLSVAQDGDPFVRMELMDGGGGDFLVITANQWAMDTEEEIDMLAAQMKALLAEGRGRK